MPIHLGATSLSMALDHCVGEGVHGAFIPDMFHDFGRSMALLHYAPFNPCFTVTLVFYFLHIPDCRIITRDTRCGTEAVVIDNETQAQGIS